MKIHIFFANLIVFSLTSLPIKACPAGQPGSIDYIRRENNRCEGIKKRTLISGSIELISLTASSDGSLSKDLSIQVPKVSSNQPHVLIRGIEKRYQLDKIKFIDRGEFYSFILPTTILKKASISLNNLRAISTTGSQVIYLPVILNNPRQKYRFVFFSTNKASFKEVEIRQGRKGIVKWRIQNSRRGEKIFEWEPGSLPAGRYEFYYKVEIEQLNSPSRVLVRSLTFEHNPLWFSKK